MNLTNVFFNLTLKTNILTGVCFRQEKNYVLKEMLSMFKNLISVISHLMSDMEAYIQWCSEAIEKQMENTRQGWSV